MKKRNSFLKIDRNVLLSTLWIFITLNYLYCDLMGLMDSSLLKQLLSGTLAGGLQITEQFLLGASILMEIPMTMVLFSRILNNPLNRILNITAGSIMTLAQAGSLWVGSVTSYYWFFSVIEISTALSIVYLAWTWPQSKKSSK